MFWLCSRIRFLSLIFSSSIYLNTSDILFFLSCLFFMLYSFCSCSLYFIFFTILYFYIKHVLLPKCYAISRLSLVRTYQGLIYTVELLLGYDFKCSLKLLSFFSHTRISLKHLTVTSGHLLETLFWNLISWEVNFVVVVSLEEKMRNRTITEVYY